MQVGAGHNLSECQKGGGREEETSEGLLPLLLVSRLCPAVSTTLPVPYSCTREGSGGPRHS